MPGFSIFSWFGFPIPMGERFKLIKAAGFDGVLIWWGNEYSDTDGDKSLNPDLARRNGLFVENVHTPYEGVNCIWLDGIDGNDFEKKLSDCIDDCSQYGIPTAVVHTSQGYTPPAFSQTGLDRIKRLVEAAEKMNVNIALENLRRPDCMNYIFSSIRSDRLGFCYDSGHENCFSKGTDFLTQYGSKLMALHLHDNDGTDDQHMLPGDGNIDWDILMKKLDAAGYSGTIALEVDSRPAHGYTDNNPEVFLKRAFYAAKGLYMKRSGIFG